MKKTYWVLIITAIIFRVFISFVIWHPDLNNHADWGIRFFQYGPKMFYAPEANVWSFTWPNQPPGTTYMFAGVRKLYEALFGLFWQINVKVPAFPSGIITYFEDNLYPALLKLPAVSADLGIAYLIYKLLKQMKNEKAGLWGAFIFLVNPVIWYNSSVWGQYDSVINFLALLSFFLLLKRSLGLSILAFVLSIYTKASLLIFLPIYAVIAIRQNYKIKEWVVSIAGTLTVIFLLTLPFARGNAFIWLYDLFVKKVFVQQLHVITANAFNLWAGVSGIHERPDSLPFLGLTFKSWSFILYAVFYIPCLWIVYRKQDVKSIFWSLSLAAFSSFMLLTNMHERYLYPLFPYLTLLFVLGDVKAWIYWGISLLSLVNLYNFWWIPRIDFIVNFLSFGDRIMPRILGLVNFGFFASVYLQFFRQKLKAKL